MAFLEEAGFELEFEEEERLARWPWGCGQAPLMLLCLWTCNPAFSNPNPKMKKQTSGGPVVVHG